ncbi:Uncharacterized protein DBV15_09350 [Temnothorax longispinosus]|uniref:Uncharacterized protein n=1 Tax=Temnothorax longispinosus TaxID=300112 RepID=A0A4S2L064_9HYME|nr:Uncharacterized protein DBV15_09350 [Temnothorax longispinosus]
MYQNQARGCFMDGNARKYALLVLLLNYGTAERLQRNCLDTKEVKVSNGYRMCCSCREEDSRMQRRAQAGRVNAGSKVLVRTEFPTLDAGYEA